MSITAEFIYIALTIKHHIAHLLRFIFRNRWSFMLFMHSFNDKVGDWGLWAKVFNATFNNIQLNYGSQIHCRRKPEYPEKTIDLWQVTDNIYCIILYRVHLEWAGFELTTLAVIGTDCIGICKYNNHTINKNILKYLLGNCCNISCKRSGQRLKFVKWNVIKQLAQLTFVISVFKSHSMKC